MLPDIKPTNRRYVTMNKNNVVDIKNPGTIADTLTEMLRVGAQQLIHQAVQAELAVFMAQYSN